MIECNKCKQNNKIQSSSIELNELRSWIKSIDINSNGSKVEATNVDNKSYSLFQCKQCNIYWEWRPLYEETMYGGEPGEWVKVTEEYVKEHYPDVNTNGN